MTTVDLTLSILVVGGGAALIVLAVVVFIRSLHGGAVRLFGRAVHRPRLWASAALCGGLTALMSEAQDVMPASWQYPSRKIVDLLEIALAVMFLGYLSSHMHAKRRQPR